MKSFSFTHISMHGASLASRTTIGGAVTVEVLTVSIRHTTVGSTDIRSIRAIETRDLEDVKTNELEENKGEDKEDKTNNSSNKLISALLELFRFTLRSHELITSFDDEEESDSTRDTEENTKEVFDKPSSVSREITKSRRE